MIGDIKVPEELKRLYRQGRLIPFIGAGVSRSVEWSEGNKIKRGLSWGEVVDGAAEMLGFSDPQLARVRGTDLQILEYFGIKNSGFAPLTNWLYSEMRPPESALKNSTIHEELTKMTNCRVFYTTNFDNFLERSFSAHGRAASVVALEAHMGDHRSGCEIVKFHGDFSWPDRMVLSESHYEDRLSFKSPMDLRLRSDMLGRAMLFLGYSFRDANVSYLFRLVNEQLKDLPASLTGRRAYIVVADPSDFELQLFNVRNIQVIPADGARLTEQISGLLREVRS